MNRPILLASGAVVAVLAVGGVAVWAERGRIAEDSARRWLGEHGAAASQIAIQDLSLTGFSASLRVGPASDPDLVIDRMEVRYDLAGPWSGSGFAVNPRSIRLVRPRLKARLDAGGLNFGALNGVIKAIAQLPPSKEPLPDFTVQDGEARLITAGGVAGLHLAGSLRAGSLATLQGQIDPVHLVFGAQRFESGGGAVGVVSYAGRLRSRLDLGAGNVTQGSRAVRVSAVRLAAETPYPGATGAWAGPATANLEIDGLAGALPGAAFDGGRLEATFEGAMKVDGRAQSVTGTARLSGQAASLDLQGVKGRLAAGQATLSQMTLSRDGGGLDAQAAVESGLALAEAAAPGVRLSALAAQMQSPSLAYRAHAGRVSVTGVVSGALAGRGRAQGPAGNGPYAAALRQALSAFTVSSKGWRLDLGSRTGETRLSLPLVVATAGGGRLTGMAEARARSLTPLSAVGSASLSTHGGGLPDLKIAVSNAALAQGAVTGDVAAQGDLDAAPARGVRFSLTGHGRIAADSGRFDLTACAPVTVDRLTLDPNPISALAARVCPSDGPLVEADRRGWRAIGRFEGLQGDLPSAPAALRAAHGTFALAGAAAGLATGRLTIEGAELKDGADPIRFATVDGAGRLDVAHGAATGTFTLALPRGPVLATIALRHDLSSGAGRADIRAPAVGFARGGLQPTDLTPLAAMARNAEGPVDFTGWFAWAPGADLTSGGEAVARNFKFSSPLGPVVGLDADIKFTSLLPLVTAPDQTLSVSQIQSVLPLSGLAASFGLGAEHLTLTTATGAMARGRIRLEPMRISLAQDTTFQGAIVFDHVNLGDILTATSLSDTVKADAVVDGRIPFEIGPNGVTVQQGHLAAVGPGRVSISRKALNGVAAGGGPPAQANFAQDLAYQAMENLAFDQMDAVINSQAHDRLGMLFHIKGRHDPPTRQTASIAVQDVLSGHALDKPMNLPSGTQIDLTLDTSLNFGDLVKAMAQAWRDALAPIRPSPRSGSVQSPAAKDATTPGAPRP